MNCLVCDALEGARVLRHKHPAHWRWWWPAPLRGLIPNDPRDKDKYRYLERREGAATKLVDECGMFNKEPQLVTLVHGQCTWCTEHLRHEKPPVCPRCVPKPPPGDPVPCPLCEGTGALRGARSVRDIVDRIVAAVKTRY